MGSGLQFLAAHERLSEHTSFRIGGPAEFFFRPIGRPELIRVMSRCRHAGLPVRVLGAGTNLLVRDAGVCGAVIATGGVRYVSAGPATVAADCGVRLARLIAVAGTCGLSGLEPLAGIPGSVGGAIVMNAGTAAGCIADAVAEITVLTPEGELAVLRPEEAGFGYRSSQVGGALVLSARLKLAPSDPERVRKAVRENWLAKRAAQPMNEASAGCVFKNPPGGSAGKIIDGLGLKGAMAGGAVVSQKHANFIVNAGPATAADVLALIERIRTAVFNALKIRLELEIDVW